MAGPSRRFVVPTMLGGLAVGLFVLRSPIAGRGLVLNFDARRHAPSDDVPIPLPTTALGDPTSAVAASVDPPPGVGRVDGLTFGIDGQSAVGGNAPGADEPTTGVHQSTAWTDEEAPADGWPRVVSDARHRWSARTKTDILADRTIVPVQGDDEDEVAPESIEGPAALSLGLVLDFVGFPQSTVHHPSPIIAAGPLDLVAAVQDQVKFYDPKGNTMVNRSVADWFTPALPADASGIDVFTPDVAYDQPGGRFVMMAMAYRARDRLSRYLLAVSDDSMAQGDWCLYSLDATSVGNTSHPEWKANWGRVATTQNAIVITANLGEAATNRAVYAVARLLAKSALYRPVGQCALPPTWRDLYDIRYSDNSTVHDLMPATSTSGPLHLLGAPYDGGDTVTAFEVALNADNPPTVTSSRRLYFPAGRYDLAPDAPQLGSSVPIDTGLADLQQAIRQGDYVWASHTVACAWPAQGDAVTRSCVRWYQLDLVRNIVAQVGTFGRPGASYFYPALVADAQQNVYVAFNGSAPNAYASARYTGRRATDAARELRQSLALHSGGGCYVNGTPPDDNEFGRRNGIALDPSGSGAWLHAETVAGTDAICGRNTWQTHIGLARWIAPTPTSTSTPRPSATSRPTRTATRTRTPRPGARTPTPTWRRVMLPMALRVAPIGAR